MEILLLLIAAIFFILWRNTTKQVSKMKSEASVLSSELEATRASSVELSEELKQAKEDIEKLEKQNKDQADHIDKLSQYEAILDIDAEIEKKRSESEAELQKKQEIADRVITEARQEAKELRDKGKATYEAAIKSTNAKLASADTEAKRIITEAESRAREIAGDAYDIAGKAKDYEKVAEAMKNVIDGYGDKYLKPTFSLLDDLAEEFGFAEAGQKLKIARENSARMIENGTAASCDYVEKSRRDTAISFVIDAFNGKVDSILSKIKKDNYGTLEQKINDAYQLVNYNGRAFRNAVITPEYLSARLEELKWGVRAQELKATAQEEQRRLREQMREEERARREYERAMKEAAKEEEMLRKAMEKAQKQIESATAANRSVYEAKLEELKQKLVEAEARGQRALSMAQQTKHGNVYVISNIGSFGENIYKVGMTRRLDPMDRVRELGDASVPFPFDVHAIIESDDAPALETTLHKTLSLMQVNKVNPRKEFFRVTLSDIKSMVENMGLKTSWTIEASAAEYRETLAIEEAMKKDPDAQRRWEEYTATITNQTTSEDNDLDE